jgi:outer membrane protein TolC
MPRTQNLPALHSIAAIAPIAPTTEAIALRAFDLYQQRGAHDGRDLDDWLEAERQLREEQRDQLVTV